MDKLETPAPLLSGQRFVLLGKFAGMSKRAARQLIRQHQGKICEKLDETVDFIVLGEAELPGQSEKDTQGRQNEELDRAVRGENASVIGESELWQQLGLVALQQDADIRNLYTPAMLAELLDIPTATVRRWHRRGLIHSKVKIHRLAYFDFQEVVTARSLAAVLAEGISPARLEKKLTSLEKFLPEVKQQLAQLTVIVEGRDILLKQGEGLLDGGGQFRFDFDTLSQKVVTTEGNLGHPAVSVLPTSPDATEAAAAEMTPAEMLEAAAELEDENRLQEAGLLYRTTLAAYGPDAEVHFRLAELLYRMGSVEAARERYYAAIELDEDFVEARANLGCVLSELGEIELAMAAWTGALAFHPDYADVHLHLARLLDEQSRGEEAEAHWRDFLELAPESPWAQQARQRLQGVEAPDH
jgi:tetratricopeptide (TPR) repeat protein